MRLFPSDLTPCRPYRRPRAERSLDDWTRLHNQDLAGLDTVSLRAEWAHALVTLAAASDERLDRPTLIGDRQQVQTLRGHLRERIAAAEHLLEGRS